ncbi:MAG: RNA helicase, partial [Chloroflexi bacterium]|nr:RNA helicase [Chloroflexota bacterium]
MTLPTLDDIKAYRETQLVERMMVWLRRGRCAREREIVETLATEGYDPVEVAAAALKLARAEEKQRPIAAISDVVPAKSRYDHSNGRSRHNGRHKKGNGHGRANRSREQGMVRLTLSAGKEQGIRPNDVVGTIAYHANIPGRVIGAIRIQEQHTFVDVPEQFVPQVLASTGKYQVRKKNLTIEHI